MHAAYACSCLPPPSALDANLAGLEGAHWSCFALFCRSVAQRSVGRSVPPPPASRPPPLLHLEHSSPAPARRFVNPHPAKESSDLALLVLDSPSEITPIKLPAEGQTVEPGTPVWNAGYRWALEFGWMFPCVLDQASALCVEAVRGTSKGTGCGSRHVCKCSQCGNSAIRRPTTVLLPHVPLQRELCRRQRDDGSRGPQDVGPGGVPPKV